MQYSKSDLYFNALVDEINTNGVAETNRNGEELRSLYNKSLLVSAGQLPYLNNRFADLTYLERELDWYLSGSRELKDAVSCSKFWAKCTDDGETVNSNYGYLLFYKRNEHHLTQFEHALQCLLNNPFTKKAVTVLYAPEHGYMSNDNPCTMFVQFHIHDSKLHIHVVMRSNDLLYGTTYDLPFFHIVHRTMLRCLRIHNPDFYNIQLGDYTHQALNLHVYSKRIAKHYDKHPITHVETESQANKLKQMMNYYTEAFAKMALGPTYMQVALTVAEKSKCLKKHCGAVIVYNDQIYGTGYGDRAQGDHCTTCARDKDEKFYSDGCYSVHAEMRAVFDLLKQHPGFDDWANVTVYVTHGPCDACCKLLDFLGVRHIVYAVPYKTDYAGHWPRLTITQGD